MRKLVANRRWLRNFPIDDARFGEFLSILGENETMSTNINICMGLTSVEYFSGSVQNPCIVAPFGVIHRIDLDQMVKIFNKLFNEELKCDKIDFGGSTGKYTEGDPESQ